MAPWPGSVEIKEEPPEDDNSSGVQEIQEPRASTATMKSKY